MFLYHFLRALGFSFPQLIAARLHLIEAQIVMLLVDGAISNAFQNGIQSINTMY